MKHIIIVLLFAICLNFAFAQEDGAAYSDGAVTVVTGEASADDPYAFVVYSETKDHATIDLSFNELTGVLRATYSIQGFPLNEADAVIAVRDSVLAFARSKGYLKARVYHDNDAISYSPDGKTAYLRRFYILYDKSGMQ